MQIRVNDNGETLYNKAQAAGIIGLTHQVFWWLVYFNVFPEPTRSDKTKRLYYSQDDVVAMTKQFDAMQKARLERIMKSMDDETKGETK